MAYYQDRFSPGTPPSLNDTSTSTTEDSYSSTPRRRRPSDHMMYGNLQPQSNAYSTPDKKYPRMRRAVSEAGVSTGGRMETKSSMDDRRDPSALQFIDDYDYKSEDEQLSSQETERDDPVSKARMLHSPKQPLRQRTHPKYYGDVRSKFEALRKTAGQDPNESFESIETPSTSSVQELKRQLWNDKEELQTGRWDQRLQSPKIDTNNTFDSDNTANFKPKYYEAAIRGREVTNSSQLAQSKHTSLDVSPVHDSRASKESHIGPPPRHQTPGSRSSQPRISVEDQRRPLVTEMVRSRSVSRTRHRSMKVPYERARNQGEDKDRESEPTRARSLSRTRDRTEVRRHSRPQSPSFDVRERQSDNATPCAASIPRNRDHIVASRVRAPHSPLIEQRIREFSQEPGGRPVENTIPSKRCSSLNSRDKAAMESSLEHLAREFGKELESMDVTGEKHRSTVSSNITCGYNTERADNTIRRITAIKDAPAQRSASMERRPPTPINNSCDLPSHGEDNYSQDGRSQQYVEIETYRREKEPSSPTVSMTDGPVPFINHSPDSKDRNQGSQCRSSEAGSSSGDRCVADLVAKLSAVNRANPAEALAQIDSILRQESRNTSIEADSQGLLTRQRDVVNTFGDNETAKQLDDDSDDETSVSELTNPTFQSSSKSFRDEVRMLSQAYNDPNTKQQNPSALSTSSFRRPRPSGLQSYIPAKLQPEITPSYLPVEVRSKSKERGEISYGHLPPLTIKVQEAQNSRSPSPARLKDRIRVTVTHKSDARESPSALPNLEDRVRLTIGQQNAKTKRQSVNEQNEKRNRSETANHVISDKETLAAKIRDWDDMSHGRETPTREKKDIPHLKNGRDDHQSRGTLPAITKMHRVHPWDGEIPSRVEKVETRDTSMENGAGVEAAITRRRDRYLDEGVSISFEVSRTEEHQPPKQKDSTTNFARDRPVIETFPEDPALSCDPRSKRHDCVEMQDTESLTRQRLVQTRPTESPQSTRTPVQRSSTMSPHVERTSHDRQLISSRPDWQHIPMQPSLAPKKGRSFSERPHASPRHHRERPERTRGIISSSTLQADDTSPEIPLFAECNPALAAVAPNNWLQPPTNDTPQTRKSRRRPGPVDTDESFDTIYSLQQNEPTSCFSVWKNNSTQPKNLVERGAIEVSLVSGEDGDFVDTSRDMPSSGIWEMPNPPQSTRDGNDENALTKNKRRGFLRAFIRKERKTKTDSTSKPESQNASGGSTGTKMSTHPVPQIRLQPVLPAFYPEAPDAIGRGRQNEKIGYPPSQRSRSASLEKFRSNNMAKKFGRVMSLYEQD